MVSKCHNPKCSTEFLYFGEGRLFEFPPDSVGQSSRLYWLCEICIRSFTLERDRGGLVHLISKADGHTAGRPDRRRLNRAS